MRTFISYYVIIRYRKRDKKSALMLNKRQYSMLVNRLYRLRLWRNALSLRFYVHEITVSYSFFAEAILPTISRSNYHSESFRTDVSTFDSQFH